MIQYLQWKWELEERMSLQAWLKRHYELFNKKESETKSSTIKAQCFALRKIVVYFMQYANEAAVIRREQQTMVGMDIEGIANRVNVSPREVHRDQMMLLSVINGLTG